MAREVALIATLALAAALVLPGPAGAATIHWRTTSFSYVAQNKPLREFIREFCASEGLTAVIAPDIDGSVSGRFNLTPSSMLDLLTTNYGLVWYFDGNILYVYPGSEVSSQVIHLRSADTARLREALARLDLVDTRYPIVYDAKQNTAFVSGPKRYVELVTQTANAVDDGEGATEVTDIRVFPLKYAWAADYTFTQGGHDVTLPGVASVLANLYGTNGAGRTTTGTASGPSSRTVSTLQKLQGLGVVGSDALPSTSSGTSTTPATTPTHGAVMARGQDVPQFQPDGRMNAVVVRDVPERMPFYESAIRALDVKPGMVEIEVRIMEVHTSEMENLGIDWRAHNGHVDAQLGDGTQPALGLPGSLAPTATNTPLGGVVTAVLGDAGHYLMARINALAQQGKANILSSPRVVTLDNVEAVVENINTFYVPVSGNLDANLFDISAGTSLRVTPLIVVEGDRHEVKLAVHVEDGNVNTNQPVGNIPSVQRNTIGTQAFVKDGESLLIGGQVTDSKTNDESGVPGLSAIPLLGNLFKYKSNSVDRVERLFMITPRVVSPI